MNTVALFVVVVALLALFLWSGHKTSLYISRIAERRKLHRKEQAMQELGMTPAEARERFRAHMRHKFPNLSAYRVVMVEGVLRHLQPLHRPACLLLSEENLEKLEGRDDYRSFYMYEDGPSGLQDVLTSSKYWMMYHMFIFQHTTTEQDESYLGYHLELLQEILERPDVTEMLLSVDGGAKVPEYCGMTLSEYNFFHETTRGQRERKTTGASSTYKITYKHSTFEFAKDNASPDYTLVSITESK